MNKRKIVIIAVLVLIASTVTVFASGGIMKTIDVFYNDIKIVIDRTQLNPKDANGNKVEPFIYNGTTYLPVRAISEAIGKEVSWDSKTSTVYIGEYDKESVTVNNWAGLYKEEYTFTYGDKRKVSDILKSDDHIQQIEIRSNGTFSYRLNFFTEIAEAEGTWVLDKSNNSRIILTPDEKQLTSQIAFVRTSNNEIVLEVDNGISLGNSFSMAENGNIYVRQQ